MRTDFDAIVVGAGPAGSSAAILLARAGWSVALIEKQGFPRRKVCGECIAASNFPLFDALGIGPAVNAAAGPELRRVALVHRDRSVTADLPAAVHPTYRWGRALGRETLDTLLLEQARSSGAEVLQPWVVQGIGGTAASWRCLARSVQTHKSVLLRAPVVIAAHGSWEPMRSPGPMHRKPRSVSDLIAFKANFRNASLDEGLLPVLSFEGGYGGMVVAGGGLTTIACCVRRDRLEAARSQRPGLRAGEVIEALLISEIGSVESVLKNTSREGEWLAAGPISPGVRLSVDDGLFRIGNAAGEAHPIIGEGMSMALQSAWLLCSHLLGAQRSNPNWQQAAARAYASEWRRHFEARLELAAAFAHMAMRPALAKPLLTVARAWPGLLTAGARWAGKLRCAADVEGRTPMPPQRDHDPRSPQADLEFSTRRSP
jgi:flavin-dependent dehydrogenase